MEAGPLESRLSMEDYEKLQSLFLGDSEAGVSFSRAEFIEQAWSAVRRGSREEYGLLFDSVVVTQEQRSLLLDSADERGERRVDWERLTSFLLLGLSEKEENERAATVPRWQPPRTLTPPHRDPVQQVVYLRSSSRYLSVSKGGTLGVWAGEDFALLQTHRLHNDSVRPKDLWVTAMVVLHNVHKIAVSFTSKELCFYDLLSKQQFSCQYKLQGLRYAPLSLDYWFHPTYPAQAVLTMGDTGGQVRGEGGRQGDKGGGEMGTGSYDGELTVWNNSTENALRKLRPDPERERSRSQTVCNVNGEEHSESSGSVSRIFFLPGRKGFATVGGADLVSCGGSGLVRFWNTVHSGLVAVFTAHKDIGSIIMTMTTCGRYLITADMEGTLKTWGIQEYCLLPSDGVTNEAPELLGSLRPHMDCVTHLETCLHGDRLLLLSASADCSVALSYLPGDTVGVFGQEEHWRLDGPGSVQVREGEPREGTVSLQSPSGTDPEFDSQPLKMREERREVVETEEAGDNTGLEREELGSIIPGDCTPPSSILGRSYKERRGLRVSDSRPGHRETPLNTDVGTFSGLRVGEVQSVGELSRPEFIIHPHHYFNRRANTSPIFTPLPANTEVVKAAFDEQSLFPKELLDEEDRPSHGARKQGSREVRINDRGRERKDRQRKGGPSGTFSGTFK
ncbi:WD repeat-containing protein 49-like [Salmo trutta]|uniref:WD repeat-containing protein 49-like n=1 Tax=Salmo trutta TaxID=8032 RepID=UPI00112FDB9E|nr:WD repeat-containing protein 49-like [Salmo trutta]